MAPFAPTHNSRRIGAVNRAYHPVANTPAYCKMSATVLAREIHFFNAIDYANIACVVVCFPVVTQDPS